MHRMMRAIHKRFKQALKGLKGLRYPPRKVTAPPDKCPGGRNDFRIVPNKSWTTPNDFRKPPNDFRTSPKKF